MGGFSQKGAFYYVSQLFVSIYVFDPNLAYLQFRALQLLEADRCSSYVMEVSHSS